MQRHVGRNSRVWIQTECYSSRVELHRHGVGFDMTDMHQAYVVWLEWKDEVTCVSISVTWIEIKRIQENMEELRALQDYVNGKRYPQERCAEIPRWSEWENYYQENIVLKKNMYQIKNDITSFVKATETFHITSSVKATETFQKITWSQKVFLTKPVIIIYDHGLFFFIIQKYSSFRWTWNRIGWGFWGGLKSLYEF
jgi:hypothetical protein